MKSTKEELATLIAKYPKIWETATYEKDEKLHAAGEIINENYFIINGVVKWTCYDTFSQQNLTINLSVADDFLPFCRHSGRMALFDKIATRKTKVYKLSEENFQWLLQNEPNFRNIVENYFLKMIYSLFEQIKILTITPASTRYHKAVEIFPILKYVSDDKVGKFLGCSGRTIWEIRNKRNKK